MWSSYALSVPFYIPYCMEGNHSPFDVNSSIALRRSPNYCISLSKVTLVTDPTTNVGKGLLLGASN